MRHRKRGRKLSRTRSHYKALRRNLVAGLLRHERITTTPAKAKEFAPWAEKLITLGKKGDLASRRRAASLLQDQDAVRRLFEEIAPRYAQRNGGYTRILRKGRNRLGDNAPQAILELVEEELPQRAPRRRPEPEEAPAAATETPAEESEEATEEADEAAADAGGEEPEADAGAEAEADTADDQDEDAGDEEPRGEADEAPEADAADDDEAEADEKADEKS